MSQTARKRVPDITRSKILEAAYQEIHVQGFQSASMSEILLKAGVTKGALYHHFENKMALGYAVVDEVVAKHRGRVILVSHRVVNKVLICALLGLDNSHFWNIRQDTCGTTTFAYQNGRFILTSHNDTSYLRPLKRAELGDF